MAMTRTKWLGNRNVNVRFPMRYVGCERRALRQSRICTGVVRENADVSEECEAAERDLWTDSLELKMSGFADIGRFLGIPSSRHAYRIKESDTSQLTP